MNRVQQLVEQVVAGADPATVLEATSTGVEAKYFGGGGERAANAWSKEMLKAGKKVWLEDSESESFGMIAAPDVASMRAKCKSLGVSPRGMIPITDPDKQIRY